MEVTCVAILLEYECTRNDRRKWSSLIILKPDMFVRYQIRMRECLEQLYFNKHFSKPFAVVSNWHALACKLTKVNLVDDMSNEENDTFSTTPQLSLLNEEGLEVVL